jgi:hypothetical protein
MELKEFIKEVIGSITDAVVELQVELKEKGAVVNPRNVTNSKVNITDEGVSYTCQNIQFEVGLSDETGKSNKKGIGVCFGNVGAEVGASKNTKLASITSVRFNIPVILPNVANWEI